MKFINFDDIVNKNNENYVNKNVFVPQHVTNTIIIGQTGCSKTNLSFNLTVIIKISLSLRVTPKNSQMTKQQTHTGMLLSKK